MSPGPTGAHLGELTRRLVELGVVTPADVHRHGLRGRDLSRSNTVVRVDVGDGRGWVVKALVARDEVSQGTPEQEQAVYRLVAGRPELARHLPGVVHVGEVGDVLVLEVVPDAESALTRAARWGWSDGRLAADLGTTLGRWHRASQPHLGALVEPGPPWVLSLLTPDRPHFVRGNHGVARFVDSLEGGWLADWLPARAACWRAEVAMHGDLQLDNCLRGRHGGITLVDWEFAGAGDAAWDVGALVAELVTQSSAMDAASVLPVLSGTVRLLVQSYRAAGPGLAREPGFGDRVLAAAAARLVLRALQLAAQDPGGDHTEGRRHVDVARSLAQQTHLAEVVA